MSSKYEISIIANITKIKFFNPPTLNELKIIVDEVAANYPYEKRLWDLSETQLNLTTNEIQSIAEYGKEKFNKPNKLALYAADDLSFGEMRQFEVYREEEGKSIPRVFRSEEEAIKWLNLKT